MASGKVNNQGVVLKEWTPVNATAVSTYNYFTITDNLCVVNVCLRLNSSLLPKGEVVVLNDVATALGKTVVPSDRLISGNCIARNAGTVSIFCRCQIYNNEMRIVNESTSETIGTNYITIMGQLVIGVTS